MVHQRHEPLFQSKRRVGTQSAFNLAEHYAKPTQDDYFVIGPSDAKFSPSVAYRNRERYYQSRSNSPPKHRPVLKEPNRFTGMTNDGQRHMVASQKNPLDRMPRQVQRQNESVQTEGHRKSLEAEIRRIRTDIEKRKRELKLGNSQPITRSTIQAQEAASRPDTKLNLRFMNHAQNRADNIPDQNKALNAPRPTHPRAIGGHLKEYTPQNQHWAPQYVRRPRSLSPNTRTRQSEYQHAYKAPEISYPQRHVAPTVPQHRSPIRPNTAPRMQPTSTQNPYETEYRREYKPFKYVPEDRLKTSIVDKSTKTHIIPIPRPKSAHIRLRSSQMFNKHERTSEKRPLTPEPPRSRKKKRYQSEYSSQYRSYSAPRAMPVFETSQPPPNNQWLVELEALREQAEAYRQRQSASHFTPLHMAQLDSNCVTMWDPPSSVRDKLLKNQNMDMSRPNWPQVKHQTDGADLITVAMRRQAMFDSHHVAQALDLDLDWSTSSEADAHVKSYDAKRFNQVCPPRSATWSPVREDDRFSRMPPQNQLNVNRARRLSPDGKVRAPMEATWSPGGPDGRNSWVGLSDPAGYHGNVSSKYSDYKRNASSMIDETGSVSSISPLSARSMVSSASLAEATLQRARRNHERAFAGVHREDPYPMRPYTPDNYASHY